MLSLEAAQLEFGSSSAWVWKQLSLSLVAAQMRISVLRMRMVINNKRLKQNLIVIIVALFENNRIIWYTINVEIEKIIIKKQWIILLLYCEKYYSCIVRSIIVVLWEVLLLYCKKYYCCIVRSIIVVLWEVLNLYCESFHL